MRARQSIVVTGASTGIGYATVSLLAREGYTVFAGARTASDLQHLGQTSDRVHGVMLDVTNGEHIAAAFAAIRASGTSLIAVVNNAGVALAGPLEYLPLDEIRATFEVNVLGTLAVTQAALPLLRASRGRVLFMSSVSGQIAPPLLGPYAASKFALEAIADSLRMELADFHVPVIVIGPGNVRTPIWEKGRRDRLRLQTRMPPAAVEHYGRAVERIITLTEREERSGMDPGVVATCVLRAIRARRPRARYAVGTPPAWQRRIAMIIPEPVRDTLIRRGIGF